MRKTLFIVDDNKMMAQFLSRMFEGKFYVMQFDSYEGAVGMMANGVRPDVCLFDYNIGNDTALDLMRAMQMMGVGYKNIPVMVLSGDKSADVRIKCFEAGVADFMLKPFHPQELRLRVERLAQLTAYAVASKPLVAAAMN